MTPAVPLALGVGVIIGLLAEPTYAWLAAIYEMRRHRRAFRVRDMGRNAQLLGARPAPQEGPPTRRCAYTSMTRGRCLRDPDHLGDHLLPVDLGLPRS